MTERRTIGQTKEALEFMEQVDSLSQQQRDHLRILVKSLIKCYVEDDCRAVVMVGRDSEPTASLLTVNCSEIEAGIIVSKIGAAIMDFNMEDAPPKEMMN
jgi:hypothetical protein